MGQGRDEGVDLRLPTGVRQTYHVSAGGQHAAVHLDRWGVLRGLPRFRIARRRGRDLPGEQTTQWHLGREGFGRWWPVAPVQRARRRAGGASGGRGSDGEEFSGAEVAFEVPNATVGYQLGYGVIVNLQRPGSLTTSRAVLMAAVKNDLALIATAEGPFRRFTPEFGPGIPSAANVEIAIDMSKYTDSFSWRGDPPR